MTVRRALPLIAILLAACDPGHLENPELFKACMLNVEKDIFIAKCGMSGCHSATAPQNGLDLVTAGVATRIKTGTSMCMSKPLISFVDEKVFNAAPSCGGSQMPLGDPLSPTERKCMKDYLAGLTDGGT